MTERRVILPFPSDDHDHHDDLNNLGYSADLNMFKRSVVDRRRVLALGLAGIGLLMVGCDTASSTGTNNNNGNGTGSCTVTPTETNGPYPADGTTASGQNLNARTISGINRTDVRTSTGTKNTAAGIPLTLTMTLVNTNASCAALAGYAVYIWHCTAGGQYSMYSSGITGEDYLRGIATTDSNGQVSFTSIFPGCYDGRWPHIHFEVFPSLAVANSATRSTLTSQIAMPEASCRAAYADSTYGSSLSNLGRVSLTSDNVFSDSYSTELATVTGSNSAGYTANITVGLSV